MTTAATVQRLRPVLAVMVVLVSLLALGGRARGNEEESERKGRALALIKEGRNRYDLGKLDEAIKLFEQAYEVYPYPEALYNLAQSWRQKGQPEESRLLLPRLLA
jgi:tetratricopeptide (TPR) repeat protein